MALLREYIIQNAIDKAYYTEDHSKPIYDRWSPHMHDAYRFPSIAAVEAEIEQEYHNSSYHILEVVTKVTP